MLFSEKLKKIRTDKDMSLAEFADLLGTSKQVLSRYERGDNTPKITTVQKYAEILNVPLSYLTDEAVEIVDNNEKIQKITKLLPDASEDQLSQIEQYIRFVLHDK